MVTITCDTLLIKCDAFTIVCYMVALGYWMRVWKTIISLLWGFDDLWHVLIIVSYF